MNDRQLENKVRKDAAKVKKDLSVLAADSAVRFNRFENNLSLASGKAKEELSTWVDDNVSQLTDDFEKLKGSARKTVAGAAATVKKEVGHSLDQYNAKAQEVANQVPGGIGAKATKYPWVSFSFALLFGFLLGVIVKPTRRPLEQF